MQSNFNDLAWDKKEGKKSDVKYEFIQGAFGQLQDSFCCLIMNFFIFYPHPRPTEEVFTCPRRRELSLE